MSMLLNAVTLYRFVAGHYCLREQRGKDRAKLNSCVAVRTCSGTRS
jgi:hypothetical protein